MQDPTYADEFEQLYLLCEEKGVAMQTIKGIAKRRWRDDDQSPRFSWYEPFRDDELITRAVHYVLHRPNLFLNTTSDATLLPKIFAAVESFDPANTAELESQVADDNAANDAEPLFIRGVSDDVRV